MGEIRAYLIFKGFPHIGQNPEMHNGSPTVIGTGLKVSTVVRTHRVCEGNLACVFESHPALAGKPELVEEIMAFYEQYRELVDPELNETYEEYVAGWHRLGFELGPDGHWVLRADRQVVNF